MSYNTDTLLLEYKNTTEYRKTIRELFNMAPIAVDIEDIDPESLDEMNYDEDPINLSMSHLFDLTCKNTLFNTLYDLAAAKMLSTDRTIGQCILFSYDYLYLFHACLCVFLKSSSEFNAECIYYKQLKEKLV